MYKITQSKHTFMMKQHEDGWYPSLQWYLIIANEWCIEVVEAVHPFDGYKTGKKVILKVPWYILTFLAV